MSKTREDERKDFVKRCMKEYYEEDRKILIDISICNVYVAKYIIGDLIYFGNNILISEEDLKLVKRLASNNSDIVQEQIRTINARAILKRKINKTTLPKATSKAEKFEKYLKDNQDIILYVEDATLYQKLLERGLRKQLYLMYKGMDDIGLFKTIYKFETIGAIQFENNGKMLFSPREEPIIKVFDSKGREKCGKVIEVKQRDIILIKSIKEDGAKNLALYEIISRHTRNQASLILRTILKKEENTNFFIEKLPYMLQNIMING